MNKLNGVVGHAIIVTLLMCLAIGSRFWLADWPNFKPVFAIAIFLGFYCRSMLVALIATMGIMLVSDAIIGFYAFDLMIAVYFSVLPALAIGYFFNRFLTRQQSWLKQTLTMVVGFLLGSISFFLLTNTATCFLTDWYPNSTTGWLSALVAGLPFFKFTVAADFLFGTAIFASYFGLKSYSTTVELAHRKLATSRI